MRGIYLEKLRFTAGEFYPELAQVGKKVLKDQVQYRYAVDPRFVESGGVKKPRNASIGVGSVFQHGTL